MPVMPWPTKWSADVKAGVFAAVFDHECSAARALELARAGQLPQLEPGKPRPVAAPELPLGTVRDWLRHERVRRTRVEKARAEPAAVLGDSIGRLAALHEREVTRAERMSRTGKLKPETLRDLARAGIELQRLAAVAGKGAARSNEPLPDASTAAPTGSSSAAPERSWLEGLAASPDMTV